MLLEVQRCANIAPFGMFHRTRRTTVIDGYHIPANTTVMMNLYSTMMDPNVFEDPSKFSPDRYLDSNGDLDKRLIGWYPYGIGDRKCLGDNIARCELFVVTCALLQRYRFLRIPGRSYSLEQTMQLTIHPEPYELLIQPL
ncbi:hypothetical protein AB6A40_005379 [Gnathostoma spinigerum]|uniref:Cytochrome P450 n=1 Tax=Gnathostoma spinigerum TaxID=75299 RepID=A0ABD6EGE4_9BILA